MIRRGGPKKQSVLPQNWIHTLVLVPCSSHGPWLSRKMSLLAMAATVWSSQHHEWDSPSRISMDWCAGHPQEQKGVLSVKKLKKYTSHLTTGPL